MSTTPTSIGPYRIIETLGSGANGEVYLAEDSRLGRKVAIKTLSARGGKEPSDRRRWLLREARAAARLSHPHIAGVYDVVESSEGAHIVMEYVRGETLASRVRRGAVPGEEVLAIAMQLADALAAAHAMGVVHRDLKPANVVITPRGEVKVLDFGLAKLRPPESESMPASSSLDFTLDGRRLGTPPYMPPEHLMGDPVDARGDLYSLGVMLYELLTGDRPFRGSDAARLTTAILTEPTPRASGRNPKVPEALDAVVYRAMSRLPEDRYASAEDLASDLRRVAAGLSPAVPSHAGDPDAPTASRPRPSIPARRRRRIIFLSALVLVAAVAVYVFVSPPRVSPTGPSDTTVVAVLPLTGASGDPELESLATGIAEVLIATLARVPGITAVSRSDALVYRDRKKAPEAIARELGATHVVDGTLQRSGEQVRVTLTLLRAGSNRVNWSSTYDGKVANIFTLQREVAEAVAQSVQRSLTADDRRRIGTAPTSSAEAMADYMQALTFLDRPDVTGNVGRAIELLARAVSRDPAFSWAHASLAEAYWQRYRETREMDWSLKARDEAAEALRLDGDDAAVRYSVAVLFKNTGRTEAAAAEFRTAIALQPGHDRAHQQLGVLLVETGQFAEGVAEIQRAIALRPNFWSHYHALGWAYMNNGRHAEAAQAFRRVTELQPDNAWGFILLGSAYDSMGDKENAARHYQRSIDVNPTPNAYSNLGSLYYRGGRLAESVVAFSAALRLDPNSPLRHRNLGDAYRKLGEGKKAQASYRRAVELSREALRANPKDASTMARLGVYLAKLGELEEAGSVSADAVTLAPTNSDVLYRRAVVFALSGRRAESIEALQQALEHGYSVALAREDDDLATLRNSSVYQALINSARPAEGGER